MEINMRKQVFDMLENIKFPTTSSRKNISTGSVEAFVLGKVNYRGQKFLGGRTKGPSKFNKKFSKLYTSIRKLIKISQPDFKYTTIQLNKNIKSPPHIDKNNVGPSYIIGLGNYTGGELSIEGKKHDIKNKWLYFDGTKGHWTECFEGTRYSLVFFTHTFKPPNPKLRNIKVTTTGYYVKDKLIISY